MEKTINKRLRIDWINISTLIVGIVGLILAFLATIYGRKSTVAIPIVQDQWEFGGWWEQVEEIEELTGNSLPHEAYWNFLVEGCFNNSEGYYKVRTYTATTFRIQNEGGMDTTLIDVKFTVDSLQTDPFIELTGMWPIVTLDRQNSDSSSSVRRLDIDSGSTVEITAEASTLREFQNVSETMTYFEAFFKNMQPSGEINMTGTWEFAFGNGDVVQKTYNQAWLITTEPHLDPDNSFRAQLEKPCTVSP